MQRLDVGLQGVDGGAAVEAGVGGDLIVTGTRGVELGTGGSDFFREGGFDIHVDVFEFDGELECSVGDLFFHLAESGFDLLEFIVGEETCVFLRTRMGDGACDVVRVEPPVVRDRLTELLDEVGGGL